MLIPESGSKHGRYLKILAEIDLDSPLLRGTKIKCNGVEVWVDFKYENLGIFCFYCGRVGQAERTCLERTGDAKNGKLLEGQFGVWLRSELRSPVDKPCNYKPCERTEPILSSGEIEGAVEEGRLELDQSLGLGNRGIFFTKGGVMQHNNKQLRIQLKAGLAKGRRYFVRSWKLERSGHYR